MALISNDILRSVRYTLDLSDQRVVDIIRLVDPDFDIDKDEVRRLTSKEGDEDFVECGTPVLARFLDGLVIHMRGRDESRPARPVETRVTNNVVLKKLRVAFELKDVDMHRIFEDAGHPVSKPELSAFFRDRSHKHFRLCGDQLLRNFLRGLSQRVRPSAAS